MPSKVLKPFSLLCCHIVVLDGGGFASDILGSGGRVHQARRREQSSGEKDSDQQLWEDSLG